MLCFVFKGDMEAKGKAFVVKNIFGRHPKVKLGIDFSVMIG